MYLYSLETFIPRAINEAQRNFEDEKVATLGPIAKILMIIVGYSNCWRGDAILGELKVWRGLTLTLQEIEDYKQLAKDEGKINL